MAEASSINFKRSVRYGFGGLGAIGAYWLQKGGVRDDPRFVGSTLVRRRRSLEASRKFSVEVESNMLVALPEQQNDVDAR